MQDCAFGWHMHAMLQIRNVAASSATGNAYVLQNWLLLAYLK